MAEANDAAVAHALRAERERLDHFAAATSGWFWETDAELRFTYMSPSVERITGVPPEWHYGKRREDIGVPADVDPEVWQAHLDTLKRRESFARFEFPRRGPDGVKWLQTSGAPYHGPDGAFLGYRGVATDVTGEVLARQTSQQLIAAIENISEMLVLWDNEDHLVVCNRRFRELNAAVGGTVQPGTSFESHIRSAQAAGLYPESDDDPETWIARRIEAHRHPAEPFELCRQDGIWLRISEHRLPDGATLTLSVDISEVKKRELALAELAATDELTGLANRRHFLLSAEEALDDARRTGRPVSVLMLDADHFKRVNDTHGHAAGDEVLRALAAITRDSVRERDVVGRLGGEEFAALLPDASLDVAMRVAERIRAGVASAPVETDAATIDVTVSVGVASAATGAESPEKLLERADAALYRAKAGGRNRVEVDPGNAAPG